MKHGTASEGATARLREIGLQMPERPDSDVPSVDPETLTSLTDQALVELMAKLAAWEDYAGTQLAAAEVDEEELQRSAEVAEATSMVRDWGGTGKDRVAVAKAQRMLDPNVEAAKKRELDAYALRKMLQSLYSSLDRQAFIVSRELTRRVGGQGQAQRERVGRFRA